MSVIQSIQEKYAKLMAIIIAVALIIFVVMLAFENGGNLFRGGNSTSVGKVNGKSIEYADFVKKVDQQKNYLEQQQNPYGGPPPTGDILQQQANDNAWNQEINLTIQNSELQKLGIKVGKKEMGDILYGANPPDDLKRQFTDSTGVYQAQRAKQQLDLILRGKSADPQQQSAREQLIGYINYLEANRQTEKYNSLFSNSVNVPKWFIEKENADKSQMAKISFVRDSYAANTDSTIKVTDKEIEEYVAKHKDDFKQPESRSIAYVTFSALPSAADTAVVRDQIASLKPEFDTVTNVAAFINRKGSIAPYADIYAGKSMMQIQNKDTILSLPVNGVFGPYIDGGAYVLAKMLGVKQYPDSVKCRHILLGTVDRSGQPIMDDSVAHAKADSIDLAIKRGANFDSLETKYSTDKKSHETKGVMTFPSTDIQQENFAKEFGQFILIDGKPGDKKVVKTSFGYHYIEILNFINVEPHYKIAYMAKSIEVSNETDNTANTEANQFAGDSRDLKSFDANAEKLKAKGINRLSAVNITPMASQIQGLGVSRSLVRKIYKAKRGETLDPEKVDDKYIVAIVTEVNEEGTVPVAKARINAEPLLRNKKIGEKLKQKLGTPATLEAAAAVLGNKPIETIDSLRMTAEAQTAVSANSISSEPKVMGAAFNPDNKGKIIVIEGGNGIFVVRVDNVMATALGDANVVEQRKTKIQQAKQQAMYRSPIQALREAATIKDRRSDIF